MYKVKPSKLLTRNNEEINFDVAESVGTQSLGEAQTKTVCVKPAFGDGGPGRTISRSSVASVQLVPWSFCVCVPMLFILLLFTLFQQWGLRLDIEKNTVPIFQFIGFVLINFLRIFLRLLNYMKPHS